MSRPRQQTRSPSSSPTPSPYKRQKSWSGHNFSGNPVDPPQLSPYASHQGPEPGSQNLISGPSLSHSFPTESTLLQTRTSHKHSLAHLLRSPSPPTLPNLHTLPSHYTSSDQISARDSGEQHHPLWEQRGRDMQAGVKGEGSRESSVDTEHRSGGTAVSGDYSTGSAGEAQGSWVYTLEVIQHPQRARACGFGDKDRRPLSPPPIIRLWIRTASGEQVDPSHVNVQFLILMTDLWSADGQQQRNVVMHPGSQLIRAPMDDDPGPSSYASHHDPRYDPEMGSSMHGYPTHFRFNVSGSPTTLTSPMLSPLATPSEEQRSSPITGWSPQDQAGPSRPISREYHPQTPRLAQPAAPPPPFPRPSGSSSARPVSAPSTAPQSSMIKSQSSSSLSHRQYTSSGAGTSPTRQVQFSENYPTSGDTTPSARPSSSRLTLPHMGRPSTSAGTSRSLRELPPPTRRPPWSPSVPRLGESSTGSSAYPTRPGTSSSSAYGEQGRSRPETSGGMSAMSGVSGAGGRPTSSAAGGARPSTGSSFPLPTTPQYGLPVSSPYIDSYDYSDPPRLQLNLPSSSAVPTANFSRVLVGSLYCICQRLLDENGQPGLFFFAHDLGVRTEGTFRLRFSLTSLAAIMQSGGSNTRGESAPVLARVDSEPFAVYSAKKFPGVIPTTQLTRVFAKQNVRLPTRQTRQSRGISEEAGSGDEEA